MDRSQWQTELREAVRSAPQLPGCYLFRDGLGNIIYVGKSRNLRSRVRTYFQQAAREDERIEKLIREIRGVEFLVTRTELDALLEEYRLIKLHKPWFNAQHKRDTPHPFLRIDRQAEYPTLTIVDAFAEDGAEYFGAFGDRFDAQDALSLLQEVWHTPVCGRDSFERPIRPCLYHGMQKCAGPCAHAVEAGAYRELVDDAIRLLAGQPAHAAECLREELQGCIRALAFEKAATIRDRLDRMDRLACRCGRRVRILPDTNAILLMRGPGEACLSAFLIEEGRVVGRADFQGAEDEQAAIAFAEQESGMRQGDWLPRCLEEVHARKLLIPLPRAFAREDLLSALSRELKAFCWGGAASL